MSNERNELLERYRKVVSDPWEFLSTCVFTMDQVDAETPVKAFPLHLAYLKLYVRIWEKQKKLLIPKSRRMVMSWTNIALFLWDTLFHEGRFNAIVSKKEEDADELIQRAKFIYEHIPESIIPRDLLPAMKYKYCALEFAQIGSKLQGFPQGADQLRQFTFSGILADEMAFWEYARKMYSSAFPTLEGGGRFTGVSSPAPGFFKQLVFDKLDDTVVAKPKRHFPMTGVELWTNVKNDFTIFQLHYSADPKKRDKAYRNYIKNSMPLAQYLQEYELQWDSFEGKPVYRDWNKQQHASKEVPHAEFGLPLLRGWDFGLTPACVIAQLQGKRLIVLHEFIGDRGIEIFSREVLTQCAVLWPEWASQRDDWRDFIDPSGNFRKDTDESTCAKIMVANGIKRIIPGAVTWEERRTAVEYFLITYEKGEALLQVSLEACPVLVRGFEGGYRYSDKVNDIEPLKVRPLKDEHCVDENTEILSKRGWLKWYQVNEGEEIYGYDFETKRLIPDQVKAVHSFKDREANLFTNANNTLIYTDKHRCVIETKAGVTKFVTAEELKQGHRLIMAKPVTCQGKQKFFSDEFIRICGWVCAEGYYRPDGQAVRLYQSKKVNPSYVECIERLLKTFPNAKRVPSNGDMVEWIIQSELAYMLRAFMPNKCPGEELINKMNNRQRRLFLYEFMRGDGHWGDKVVPEPGHLQRNRDFFVTNQCVRAFQKRKDVIDALQNIACLAGMPSSVNNTLKDGYTFTLLKSYEYIDYQGLTKDRVKLGLVWCPETITGTWVMRSEGRTYITGNSHVHDAFQYLCSRIANVRKKSSGRHVPGPGYSWMKGKGDLKIPKTLAG